MSSLLFNANEVFEIARQIERNGQTFYEKAATVMSDPTAAKLMTDLAGMEKAHENLFASMQKTLSGSEVDETLYDPHDDAFVFLKGMADNCVFNPKEAPAAIFAGNPTVGQVLDLAIPREKDSVIFYEGIKVIVPEKFGRARIDDIIAEEMGHILMLSRQKSKIV